ncbi:hypothetical protein BKA81DRAFT_374063, partial [Phyllosticta paracitricarpa]
MDEDACRGRKQEPTDSQSHGRGACEVDEAERNMMRQRGASAGAESILVEKVAEQGVLRSARSCSAWTDAVARPGAGWRMAMDVVVLRGVGA